MARREGGSGAAARDVSAPAEVRDFSTLIELVGVFAVEDGRVVRQWDFYAE